MNCKPKRTIFEFLQIYSCDNCKYQKEDEFIYIGSKLIGIYYPVINCPHLKDEQYFIDNNLRLNKLLLEACLYQNEIFFLWFDNFKLNYYYSIFEAIIEEDYSIQILII